MQSPLVVGIVERGDKSNALNPRALAKSPRRFSSPCSLLLYGWGYSKITDAPRRFEGTSTRRAKNALSARFGPGTASTAWRGSPQPRRPPGSAGARRYIVSNCLPFDERTTTKVVVERDPSTTAARCSARIRIVCNGPDSDTAGISLSGVQRILRKTIPYLCDDQGLARVTNCGGSQRQICHLTGASLIAKMTLL